MTGTEHPVRYWESPQLLDSDQPIDDVSTFHKMILADMAHRITLMSKPTMMRGAARNALTLIERTPDGTVIYFSDLRARGWKEDDIAEKLGTPHQTRELHAGINVKVDKRTARMWLLKDALNAELTDPELLSRVKDTVRRLKERPGTPNPH